jgi:S-formylglutathione hydrolase
MGITGHSMGGHGALTIGLKNPSKFKSLSAFAPICHPSVSPWGVKAFKGYLGDDTSTWKDYDATELIRSIGKPLYSNILIDVGTKDSFLGAGQLLPEVTLAL